MPKPDDAVESAAYAFVESMVPRADFLTSAGAYPAWHGWALREGFHAGIAEGLRMAAEACDKLDADLNDGGYCYRCAAAIRALASPAGSATGKGEAK